MSALETMLEKAGTKFLCGDSPSIADVQICAQCYDMILHGYSWTPYPKASKWRNSFWDDVEGFKTIHEKWYWEVLEK